MEKLMPLVAVKEIPATRQYDDLKGQLGKLGFTALTTKVEIAKKLAIAHAKYGYVTGEMIDKFNRALRAKTERMENGYRMFQRLLFTKVETYGKIPPPEVLAKMQEAIDDGIFDSFEVAAIHDVQELIDPILFGCIQGTNDKFFIAQWDDDVKIEDIVNAE